MGKVSEPTILTATCTYGADEPAEGLHKTIAEARTIGARIQLDSAGGDLHVVLTAESETESVFAIAQELAVLAAALPPGATTATSSWRQTGPVPF